MRDKPYRKPSFAAALSLIRRLRRHLPSGEGLLHRLPLLASLGGRLNVCRRLASPSLIRRLRRHLPPFLLSNIF